MGYLPPHLRIFLQNFFFKNTIVFFFCIGFTSLESPCTLHFTQKELAVCLNSLTTEHSGWDAWHAVKWSFSGAFVSVKTALCANNNQERCIVHSALHRFSAPYCRVGFSAESRARSICGIPAQAFVAFLQTESSPKEPALSSLCILSRSA